VISDERGGEAAEGAETHRRRWDGRICFGGSFCKNALDLVSGPSPVEASAQSAFSVSLNATEPQEASSSHGSRGRRRRPAAPEQSFGGQKGKEGRRQRREMAGGQAQEGSPDQSPQGHPPPHRKPSLPTPRNPYSLLMMSNC
jgi:hypothetical protein